MFPGQVDKLSSIEVKTKLSHLGKDMDYCGKESFRVLHQKWGWNRTL